MTRRLLACWFILVLWGIPVHAGWIKARGGEVPPKAIVAGKDRDGQPSYVCRAQYDGGVFPGALAGVSQDCSISRDGTAYSVSDYEVLAGDGYIWVAAYNGQVPFDALVAGRGPQGGALYICRGEVNSEWGPGTMSQTDSGCRVSNAGKELTAQWYEVLVGS